VSDISYQSLSSSIKVRDPLPLLELFYVLLFCPFILAYFWIIILIMYLKLYCFIKDCFKIVLMWKLLVEMIFLNLVILRKILVLKYFSIIENYFYYFRDGKSLLSDSNEKRSVKTLPHVASRVTKHREKSKNSYENDKDFYKWGMCVEETIILALKIFTDIHRCLSSIPLLEWKRNHWRTLRRW
jgi:energy-coupling factor transporter transmembrane protein EcfT